MNVDTTHRFWRQSTPAAKWAAVTAALLIAIAVVPFALLTVVVTQSQHVSPTTAIFGPGLGNPAVTWLYFTVPPAAIQLAASLVLRRPEAVTQIAAIVAVLILATIALVWLGAIVVLAVRWLIDGTLAGDFYDLGGHLIP